MGFLRRLRTSWLGRDWTLLNRPPEGDNEVVLLASHGHHRQPRTTEDHHLTEDRVIPELGERNRPRERTHGLDVDGAEVLVGCGVLVRFASNARNADHSFAFGRMVEKAEITNLHRAQIVARL